MQLYTANGLQRWSTIRAFGMRRFILLYGVVPYGLIAGTLGSYLLWRFFDREMGALDILVHYLLTVPLGLLFGWVVWRINERRFLADAARQP